MKNPDIDFNLGAADHYAIVRVGDPKDRQITTIFQFEGRDHDIFDFWEAQKVFPFNRYCSRKAAKIEAKIIAYNEGYRYIESWRPRTDRNNGAIYESDEAFDKRFADFVAARKSK